MEKKKEEYDPYKTVRRDTLISEMRFGCTQAWFTRAKWENKLHFFSTLLKLQKGFYFIRFLSEAILAMSKDAIYAMDSKTNTYDLPPHGDDDRELDPATLQYMMKQDIIKFARMDQEEQTDFLTGLVKIGGEALVRRALKEIETNISSSEMHNKHLEQYINKIDKENRVKMNRPSLKPKQRVSGEGQVDNSTINENEPIRDPVKDQDNPESSVMKEEEMEESTSTKIQLSPQVKAAKQVWTDEMHHVQKLIDSWNPHARYTDSRKLIPNVQADTMQCLPLWITRYFAKMLPQESQKEIRKLNDFWARTVDDMQKEISTQSIIEKRLQRLQVESKSPSKIENNTQNEQSKDLPGKLAPKRKSKSSSLLKPPPQKATAIVKKDIKFRPKTKTLIKLLEVNGDHAHTYNDQYCTTDVCRIFLSSRVVACSSKNILATSTPGQSIAFFSLLTGSELSPYLEGHTGIVTCLNFHPNGEQIFSGSSDLTIRCWDIWSGKTAKTYFGHNSPITCLGVNNRYLASGSNDGTILVHFVTSGQLIGTYKNENTITCIFMDIDDLITVSGNSAGEIKLSYHKKPKDNSITAKCHNGQILSFFIDKNIILTGGDDGYAKVWKKKNPRKCLAVMNNLSPVRSITFSFHQVLCGCESGYLKIWCVLKCILLLSLPITPQLQPILQILIPRPEKNPSKLLIATDSSVQIIEFYCKNESSCHNHHTTCYNDPTRTKSFFVPACEWTAPKALTELMMQSNNVSKGRVTLRESYYHKRLRRILEKSCCDKSLRNKEPPNSQESVFLDALRTIPQYTQVQYGLITFPRNDTEKSPMTCCQNYKRKF